MSRYVISSVLLFVLVVPLRAQNGFANLRSQPPGAQVFVDDSLFGVTPLLIRLRVGTHRVAFRSENGGPVMLHIDIAENEVTTHEVTIAAHYSLSTPSQRISDGETGKITVITDQPGADITIDGRPTGARTPVTVDHVPAGRHIVRAIAYLNKLQDNFSVAETVLVVAGRTALVRISYGTHTTEGILRLESNDPQLALTLRHIDSDKRYALRKTGPQRVVTGRYEIEVGRDSLGVPRADPITVTEDSVTVLSVLHYTRMLQLKSLRDHTSYVDIDQFLQRSFKPRPLSETRSDLTVSQHFAWWLGGGVAMILVGEIMNSEESIRQSQNEGLAHQYKQETVRTLRAAGLVSLITGALLSSRIDTVQVDLSFNQQANRKDEDFLRARYVDLVATWQDQIDQENRRITEENRRRAIANDALPKPSVLLEPR